MKPFIFIFFVFLATITTAFAVPPGLQGKAYPHGLYQRGETPYGWSQGRKVGWERRGYYYQHGRYYRYRYRHHIGE